MLCSLPFRIDKGPLLDFSGPDGEPGWQGSSRASLGRAVPPILRKGSLAVWPCASEPEGLPRGYQGRPQCR